MSCQSSGIPKVQQRQRQQHQWTVSHEDIATFYDNVNSLWVTQQIPVLQKPPTALVFLRDYVSMNRPCIIQNAITLESNNNQKVPLHLTLNEIIIEHSKKKYCHDSQITVHVTPDGFGDCVRLVQTQDQDTEYVFVQPMDVSMTLLEFQKHLQKQQQQQQLQRQRKQQMEHLRLDKQKPNLSLFKNDLDENNRKLLNGYYKNDHYCSKSEEQNADNKQKIIKECANNEESFIVYYSLQNNCLNTEFSWLFDNYNIPKSISWAEEAFGTGPPDAMNIWIGNECVVSSLHKDHYENLFYVASGEKIFYICPPATAPCWEEKAYKNGHFETIQTKSTTNNNNNNNNDEKEWKVCIESTISSDNNNNDDDNHDKVHWIYPDVISGNQTILHEKYPGLKYVQMLKVHVPQGSMLYLPSLWYHRVTQSCETVGINYWYDMKFDSPLYCYHELLQRQVKN